MTREVCLSAKYRVSAVQYAAGYNIDIDMVACDMESRWQSVHGIYSTLSAAIRSITLNIHRHTLIETQLSIDSDFGRFY